MQTYLKLQIVTADRNQFTLFSVQGGILNLVGVERVRVINIIMGDYFYPIADWGPPILSNTLNFLNVLNDRNCFQQCCLACIIIIFSKYINNVTVRDIPTTIWQTLVSTKIELQLHFQHICFMTLITVFFNPCKDKCGPTPLTNSMCIPFQ